MPLSRAAAPVNDEAQGFRSVLRTKLRSEGKGREEAIRHKATTSRLSKFSIRC